MDFAIAFLPLAMALIALLIPVNRYRPWILPATGIAHSILTAILISKPVEPSTTALLAIDAPGKLILATVSGLFLICSFYAVGYLGWRLERSNRVFCACYTALLGLMSLVALSRHLGLMWVSVETMALLTAPLLYFNRTPRSIEATWKYLLVGSIGIALALFGTYFLAYSSIHAGLEPSLHIDRFLENATKLSKPWLRAAFVLLLVGYGTKMGLAPMHTWKPDAYGEAPGVVGAFLAGGVANCAFLAVLRVYHICASAGETKMASSLLLFIGLLSIGVAAVFMIGQKDFKRMLAYSSVEHMGILVLGLGIGGGAIYGALYHVVNNAAVKCVMFLSAGNIRRAYDGKTIDKVSGAIRALPISGYLFVVGFLAIAASPPFGPFFSEFKILGSAFASGRYVVAGLFLLFLQIVFIGMGSTVLSVAQGPAPDPAKLTRYRDGWLTVLPPLIALLIALLLGLYVPEPLKALLNEAASSIEVFP